MSIYFKKTEVKNVVIPDVSGEDPVDASNTLTDLGFTVVTEYKYTASKNPTVYSCSNGYTLNGNVCTKRIYENITVTYYRYSTRSCVGGSTDIKWSTSNDQSLLKNGYRLTGNKRALSAQVLKQGEKENE